MKTKFIIALLILLSSLNTKAQKSKLLGSWKANNGTLTTFYKNTVKMGGDTYTYEVNGQYLTMYNDAGQTLEYTWKVQGKTLKLTMPGYGTFTLTKVSKGSRHTAHASRSGSHKLIGTWQATSGAYMVFTKNQMMINNLNYTYRLQSNRIIVSDGYGNTETFTYNLRGKNMTLNIPGVGTYNLTKISNDTGGGYQNTSYGNQGYGNQGYGGGGNTQYVYGTFCSYSSSGYSGSSSYSTVQRVTFDGRGHYTYGSESSYSGGGDGYYGGGGGNGGTYTVQGNRVILTDASGGQYVASIHMQQNSGEVTELMYDGTLFAKQLCD